MHHFQPCVWPCMYACARAVKVIAILVGSDVRRCVQGPVTYSPRHPDARLLVHLTLCGRIAARNPNKRKDLKIGLSLSLAT